MDKNYFSINLLCHFTIESNDYDVYNSGHVIQATKRIDISFTELNAMDIYFTKKIYDILIFA